MLLQNQIALCERVLLIGKVNHLLAIDFDDNVIALRDDVLIEPGVRWDEFFVDLHEAVKASGPHRIFVGAIDLCFITLGKSRSPGGAEQHAGVSAIADFDVCLELAVPALPLHPEEMTSLAVTDNRPLFDLPRIGVLVRLPTIQGFPIKHVDPVVLLRREHGNGEQAKTENGKPLRKVHEHNGIASNFLCMDEKMT